MDMQLGSFSGVKIKESIHAVRKEIDLSSFRFLSFHKSRLKRNRPKITYVPEAYKTPFGIIAHPAIIKHLRSKYWEQ